MNTLESLEWLTKNKLINSCKEYSSFLKNIFKHCLNVKNESILIIGDIGYEGRAVAPLLAGSYYFAARKLGFKPRLFFQVPKLRNEMVDRTIANAIDFLANKSVILLALSNRLGKINGVRSYRSLCKSRRMKFVTTPSLGFIPTRRFGYLIETFNIPYLEIQKKHQEIKSVIMNGRELHVKTPIGTDLHMKIDWRTLKSADGNYRDYGSGGNLPAGEVYFAPKKHSVNGTIVIDGSINTKTGTILVKNPIKIKINDGVVVGIKGKEEAKILEETIEWAENNTKNPIGIRKVCEFGIGLNPKAKIIGSTIIDEKALGTAHIAIGSNHWFGGSIFAKTHLDLVFRKPKITVDGHSLKI